MAGTAGSNANLVIHICILCQNHILSSIHEYKTSLAYGCPWNPVHLFSFSDYLSAISLNPIFSMLS